MHKILVVDDEYLSREAIKLVVKEELKDEVEVLEAANGIEAKHILDNYSLDIILLDINIPGINGVDLCKYIKAKFPNISIIVITAYDDLDIKNKIMDFNIEKYFIKPVRPQYIINSLNKIIYKYKKEDIMSYQKHLTNLSKCIEDNCYKESVDTIKTYINKIYSTNDEILVEKDLKLFINGIDNISKSKNLHTYQNISDKIQILDKEYMQFFKRKKLIDELTSLIKDIFDIILSDESITNNYVKDILNYIERNISKNITLEDAAGFVNLSPHYLSKIFKKETGVNFITYLTNRRIDIAKEMLENENIPISNIAIELCYSKSNYFSKVFKKNVGVTPTKYREDYLRHKDRDPELA